jgi:hypothetical protein
MRTLVGYCKRLTPARSAAAYAHQVQRKQTILGSKSVWVMKILSRFGSHNLWFCACRKTGRERKASIWRRLSLLPTWKFHTPKCYVGHFILWTCTKSLFGNCFACLWFGPVSSSPAVGDKPRPYNTNRLNAGRGGLYARPRGRAPRLQTSTKQALSQKATARIWDKSCLGLKPLSWALCDGHVAAQLPQPLHKMVFTLQICFSGK